MGELKKLLSKGGGGRGARADSLPSLAEESRCGVASTVRASRVPGTSGPSGAEGPSEPAGPSEPSLSMGAAMFSRSAGQQEALSPPRCFHTHHPGAWTVALGRGETQGYQAYCAQAPGNIFTRAGTWK